MSHESAAVTAVPHQELREAKRLDPARANRYVTGALRLTPDDSNLDVIVAGLKQ